MREELTMSDDERVADENPIASPVYLTNVIMMNYRANEKKLNQEKNWIKNQN